MQSQILPSRAALVDRIALQFEYGQNLIVLLGPSGLGKSYLLETFITDKYSDFNKSFVQLSARMSDMQLMSELLEQSFRSPLIDQNLSLSENFYQLAKQQNCGPCLWVLDGGRHLSEEMVEELTTLTKHSPTTLYVLLASQSVGQFKSAVEIHLEALSIAESKQLMKCYFNDLPYDEDPVFQTFLREAHGNPSLLLAWQPTQHTAKVVVTDKVSWRVHLITLLVIIMLLIIGFLYKSDMTRWWHDFYQPQPETPVATAIAVDTLKQAVTEPAVTIDSSQVEAADAQSADQQAQPEQDKPLIDNPTQENNVAAILDSLAPVAEPVDITTSLAEEPTVVEPVPQAQQIMPADNAWYLQQPDSKVVIQLLAVTQQTIAEQFVAKQSLQVLGKVYQTRRNDKIWWVVTYGSFDNLNAAREVLASLPEAVRKNQPFYKKISKIKQEIALLDQ
ncbi:MULTISPECIES: AAA family ATPase [unclassified Pseudoalteromonas]|uniref:AAA family ATPase n=1 Tax=unclassified Pseudoalteromonas TaxID=194690 RepID=UPI001600310F|nr:MULTISPECIES: AAA family ATPase [unclassified Pseudoalteromonas]MBB1311201.1 AAA family ATPase [Pseudoalteromonas sp. SR41-8]MBB1409495.1 AAA family ATPase [Pseudoalteromonas sp. SG44-17]